MGGGQLVGIRVGYAERVRGRVRVTRGGGVGCCSVVVV